jgi:ActR/RegA family two-component response regulator
LLVDLKMPRIDGLQIIEQVRAFDPNAIIVLITGYATIAAAVDAMKAGAYDFLASPSHPRNSEEPSAAA